LQHSSSCTHNTSQKYEVSLVIWDHTCDPTQVNTPHLNPSQCNAPDRLLLDLLPTQEGWKAEFEFDGMLHTETVYLYLSADGHPFM